MATETVIQVDNLSKMYNLSEVGTGTIASDLNRWWAKVRGKPDPYMRLAEVNDRTTSQNNPFVWAIKNLTFEVKKGEVIGIIGRNGAGKSTLLKVLSRVTAPTEGEARFKGRIASLLEVGTGFHGELTGRENIYLNGAILGMSRKEVAAKLDEIVAFANIERYLDTPVKRYSSGMYVRLAFAVAAHLEPEILIVDEVLAVGDIEFQKKAIGKLQDVSRGEGKTVLFVSHNMGSIAELCDRAIVLDNGEITFNGGVDEAIDKYIKDNKYIAAKIAESPIDETKECFLTSYQAYNDKNEQTEIFDLNENINLKVNYTLNNAYTDVSIRLRVYRNGRIVFSTFDTDQRQEFFSRSEGEYESTVVIPKMFLKAGAYDIDIAIRRNLNGLVLDEISPAIRFYVEELSINTQTLSFKHNRLGEIIFPNAWAIKKLE